MTISFGPIEVIEVSSRKALQQQLEDVVDSEYYPNRRYQYLSLDDYEAEKHNSSSGAATTTGPLNNINNNNNNHDQQHQRATMATEGSDEEEFETAVALKAWLRSKGVGERKAAEAAAVLFEKDFDSPSSLIGISPDVLHRNGLSDAAAQTLSNKLAKPQQQQRQNVVPDLSALIPDQDESRRKSLDAEREEKIPTVEQNNRDVLGTYLKFVNREKSINQLMMHSAEQYFMFLGGIKENQLQYAACSGGPGLGKTTFCRKAFTRAADVSNTSDKLWEGVPNKDKFHSVVKACVNAGRQYRISYGGALLLSELDVKYPSTSFARRIVMQCVPKNKIVGFPKVDGTDQLRRVIHRITRGQRDSLVVINIDETNKLMEHASGSQYLRQVLTAVLEINKMRKGFVFCILSGTNVRPLHDLLFASSGKAPKEIPLPLLEVRHMNDVLFDLARRGQVSDQHMNDVLSDSARRGQVSDHKPDELQFVLKVLGGVPRYIEMLVYCLGEDADSKQFTIGTYCSALKTMDFKPHNLLERVKAAMNAQYGPEFTEIIAGLPCNVLVALSLFRWPVARNYKVGSHEVGELEKRGIVFLHKRQEEERNFIVFPLILLLNLAQVAAGGNSPMLLQNFNVMLSSDENERNSLAIFALKCSALCKMGEHATLNELFQLNDRFPNLSDQIRKTEMSFDSFGLQEAESRVDKSTWDQWLQKLGKAGCFLVNCKGASFADMIIVSKGGNFVIFLQEKQREVAKQKAAKKQKVPLDNKVEIEHEKCNVATPHLFVFITDEDFSEQSSLKENEIVLSYREHSIAIGPLLALLRKYNHSYRPKINI